MLGSFLTGRALSRFAPRSYCCSLLVADLPGVLNESIVCEFHFGVLFLFVRSSRPKRRWRCVVRGSRTFGGRCFYSLFLGVPPLSFFLRGYLDRVEKVFLSFVNGRVSYHGIYLECSGFIL